MINITKDKFEYYVFSATSSSAEIYDMIGSALYDAMGYLERNVIGSAVYNSLETDSLLLTNCEKFVCLMAYKNAIPSLDLVLTATGFGVVSNQSVAPASAERVQKLIAAIDSSLSDCEDNIYDLLRGDARWSYTKIAQEIFCTPFWKASILRKVGYPSADRNILRQKMAQILPAQAHIKQIISAEFYSELLSALRLNVETELQDITIKFIQVAIACIIENDARAFELQIKSLLRFLDSQIDEFPTYMASTAYAANHFTHYQNEKEDSCFFWG